MNWPALLLVATAPTAIVDTVYGVPGLAPLTLLDPGTELVVGAGRVRLAYFESCVHETIRGGRLRIGITASVADDAVVERVAADCAPPVEYAAGHPGALVLRGSRQPQTPTLRVRTRRPIFLMRDGTVEVSEPLRPGAGYRACSPRGCVHLRIDADARRDSGSVLERIVRLP